MVRPRRFRLFALVAALLALVATGCGGNSESAAPATATQPAASDGDSSANPNAATGEPLRLGVIFALSGPLSAQDIEAFEGIELVVDNVNEEGGIDGRPIELIVADYESSPDLVVPRVRELIAQDVIAILGPGTVSVLPTLEPIAEAAEVPIVSTAGTAPAHAWTFATFPLTGYFDLMAEYPLENGKDVLCAMHVPGGNQETQEKFVYPVFEQVGNPVAQAVQIELTGTDLTPQMAILRDAGCNAVYVAQAGDAVVRAAQAAANLGMTDVMITTHGGNSNPATVEAIGGNADFVYFALPKAAVADQLPESDPKREEVLEFFTSYQDETGEAATPSVVIGYATGQIVVDALQSGATTGSELRDYLETQSVDTVLGEYAKSPSNHNGALSDGYFIMGRWDPDAERYVLD
jgi:branched-chain amino acid transport system substrate-binding protein